MKKRYFKHFIGMSLKLRTTGLPHGSPTQILYELMTYWIRSDDNEIYPSIETLMQATGYDRQMITRAFNFIRNSKLLEDVGGGYGRSPIRWRVSPLFKAIINEFEDKKS